jgi:DNA-binding MurR/RpiR family transcriptional regulator
MGITISSKRYSCDMGYGGFGRFRNAVAEKINDEFYKHYIEMDEPKVMLLLGEARENYFKKYNADTDKLIERNVVTVEVANFLYQCDCGGSIDRKQAKQIYKLIKDCDNNIAFGYIGRSDCAKMEDMKKIFSDGTKVKWS